jgi:hypothetical protein
MLESYNNKKLAKIQKKKIREKVLYQQRVHIVTNSNTMLCKRIGERCFFFFIYNIYKYLYNPRAFMSLPNPPLPYYNKPSNRYRW